jgi:hypothetical protein
MTRDEVQALLRFAVRCQLVRGVESTTDFAVLVNSRAGSRACVTLRVVFARERLAHEALVNLSIAAKSSPGLHVFRVFSRTDFI